MTIPKGNDEARNIKYRSSRYFFRDEKLYKRGILAPSSKCLNEKVATTKIKEVHEGICGTHASGFTMARQIMRLGYY